MKTVLTVMITLYLFIQPAFADNSWSKGADINDDGVVDNKDFAILSKYWLANKADFPDITWVYVDDDGSGMIDEDGNPIDEGGFTGYISKYETTNIQFCKYLRAALKCGDIIVEDNYIKAAKGAFESQIYYQIDGPGDDGLGASRINYTENTFTVDAGFENHPVTYVTWYGASAFASYYDWYLPTEWQWQAVADFDGSYTYGCGTTISDTKANYSDTIHPNGTTPVDTYRPYGYGLCDMAGNVWEWTTSQWNEEYYYLRVFRGGSWWARPTYRCEVSFRQDQVKDFLSFDIGFRVCK